MALCSLCQRIKEIRLYQGRSYYNDLCKNCREEELKEVFIRMKRKIAVNELKNEFTKKKAPL